MRRAKSAGFKIRRFGNEVAGKRNFPPETLLCRRLQHFKF